MSSIRNFFNSWKSAKLFHEVRSYNVARENLETTCLHLGSNGHTLDIVLFSGELSHHPSLRTIEVFSKKECENNIGKLTFGGGPGISITQEKLPVLDGYTKRHASIFFKDPTIFGKTRSKSVSLYDCESYKDDKPVNTLYNTHPYMEFYNKTKSRGVPSHFLVEPLTNHTNIEITRQHVAFIRTTINNKNTIPIAVVEDLHLPFSPRDAIIYRNISEHDRLYQVFCEIEKRFTITCDTLEEKPPCRVIEPGI